MLAVLLGLAQGAAPALASAHELVAAGFGAPVAHVEAQGTTHEVTAHSHDCGICRNAGSRVGLPGASCAALGDGQGSGELGLTAAFAAVHGDLPGALARGPPLG